MDKTLNNEHYITFRNNLEERRDHLRALLHHDKPAPERSESDSQDIESSYLSDQEHQVDKEINDQHILELREIEAALQRMASGHYGICQDCGAPIDIKRLTAYPVARRCIDCKQAFEQASANTRSN